MALPFEGIDPQKPAGSIVNLMGINFKIIDPEEYDGKPIPAITYEDDVELRSLVKTNCGHFCPIDPTFSLYPPKQGLYVGQSYTGKHYCHLHAARCQGCGRTLCVQGNPRSDAYKVDPEDGNKPQYFCYDCHEKIKWSNMIDSFWSGILYPFS